MCILNYHVAKQLLMRNLITLDYSILKRRVEGRFVRPAPPRKALYYLVLSTQQELIIEH